METAVVICIAIFLGMILALIFGGVMGLFVSIGLFVGAVVLYFLPSILAIHKKHKSALWIFLVNVFFGWSVLGWIIALLWAFDFNVIMKEFMEYRREKAAKPAEDEAQKDTIIEGEYTKAE